MNQRDLVKRFRKGATSGQSSNMLINGDVLYSYGRHFPLTIRLDGGGFLHNGDRYSMITSGHQSHARSVLDGPQVPFSALNAAGVSERDRYSLEIVDITPDHREWVCKHPDQPHKFDAWSCDDGYEKHILGGTLIRHKRRYLLSAIDFESSPATRPLFFLCQLPTKVSSIEDAYESLMPYQVKVAQALGADVQRQGDMFFVRSTLGTKELTPVKREPASRIVWRQGGRR